MSSGKAWRRRPLNTIGLRLTLWGAGITFVVCLALCGLLYAGAAFSLRNEVDGFLEGEVSEFIAILNEHPGDYEAASKSVQLELGQRVRHDLSFRLIDDDGGIVLSSEPETAAGTYWLPPAGWDADDNHGRFHTVRLPGARYPIRVCSRRFTTPDGQPRIAQAAYLLDRLTTSLATFRRICVAALLFAIVAALAGGRIIARRSLRPLQTMTAEARQISARKLNQRLAYRGTGDELDRLAETLNRMLDRIETYVRQMQQFTADASHELRSPLSALRGNAEVVLTRERSVAELRQVIEESVEHYDRLARIAEDLLLLARVDAGEDIFRLEPVQLDAAIADVVDLYGPVAADRGLELTFPGNGEAWVEGDGGRLRQLLGNLIDNAIKYTTPPGRVEVSLSTRDGEAWVKVTDTGTGIAPESLPHVFDRFFRGDRARSGAQTGGAGLGLSICRSIVDAHRGQITIDSTLGRGTIVTIRLRICSKETASHA